MSKTFEFCEDDDALLVFCTRASLQPLMPITIFTATDIDTNTTTTTTQVNCYTVRLLPPGSAELKLLTNGLTGLARNSFEVRRENFRKADQLQSFTVAGDGVP